MAYELEGTNPSHSFGDGITFNVFHCPPIVDYCRTVAPEIMAKAGDWLANDGQELEHADAAEFGRLLMVSLLDGHFEKISANFNEEEYLVRPGLLGNAMFKDAVIIVPGRLRRVPYPLGMGSDSWNIALLRLIAMYATVAAHYS